MKVSHIIGDCVCIGNKEDIVQDALKDAADMKETVLMNIQSANNR